MSLQQHEKNDNGTIKLLSTGNFDGVALREDAIDYINNDEVFTIPSGGSANIKYYNGEFVDSGNIIGTSLDNKLYNTKYIYYFLENNNELIQSYFRGSGVKHPDMSAILNIRVAVPPLEVQDEIVRILDDFTLLSAELSAELKAREKQYEYYKDNLFDFEDKVKVPLSEICSMERGGNFQKKHFTKEGIPAIHYGKIYTYYGLYTDKTLNFIDEIIAKKQKFANNNDIVMAVTSENVEDVCKSVVWEGKEPVAVSGHSVIIRHNQNARFLAYYFTTSHFQKQKEKYCIGTKVIEMKPDNLAKILVPIPSIEEQNRIVSILDKFYSITNDISEGLPAEIEARQKQYEYYRNKLLNF